MRGESLLKPVGFKRTPSHGEYRCGLKSITWGYAGFSLWFYMASYNGGTCFLTHSHVYILFPVDFSKWKLFKLAPEGADD